MMCHLRQTENMIRISLRKFYNTKENIIKILFGMTFLYVIEGCSYYFAMERLLTEISLDQLEDFMFMTFDPFNLRPGVQNVSCS